MSSSPSLSNQGTNKIGFGCYGVTESQANEWIREAIITGYRHFDCAFLYQNESAIGKGLRKCINQGLIRREEIFITSKLPMNGMDPTRVNYFLTKTLENLDCDYLDLYLIHAPFCVKYITDNQFYPVNPESGRLDIDHTTNLNETWKSMEQVVDSGLVRSIGLSNFNENQMIDLMASCEIKPSIVQNETHVYFQQKSLRNFCHQNDIIYQSFAPLGSAKSAAINGHDLVIEDATINQLAVKYQVSNSQICLRWHQQSNITPIVGFDSLQHIRENIKLNHFTLSTDDLAIISQLDRNERIFYFDKVPGTRSHRYYPF
ncbi:uncharacterized protein LOC128390214 [Panonychus citri]|uniref:uncharacterized protein LOC128390214 n=1 Tax=Panonychus citri TaxID=50023 RepID=UPI002307FCE4|nr:uncharacterized protein LOC128390214 [Panonychus citri]